VFNLEPHQKTYGGVEVSTALKRMVSFAHRPLDPGLPKRNTYEVKYITWKLRISLQSTNANILEPYNVLWRPGQCSRHSDSLRGGRSGDRIPVGARFSFLFQTVPGGQPASCTMAAGSFPRIKPLGRADHPHPSSTDDANVSELYPRLSPLPALACHGVTFTSTMCHNNSEESAFHTFRCKKK
jgi:hypothetical protein